MSHRSIYLSLLVLSCSRLCAEDAGIPGTRPTNQIIVSPDGPADGGDFGPKTPGTKTSGLQEAFDAAKLYGKDVYVAGGSWTADKTTPVVYHLHATLKVPWMQNFRFDSGHAVLNYTQKTGDAVVIDSQMSCHYRFGLIVCISDGAVVRLRPTSEGPDRFRVITSTEFVFNALVGGGGIGLAVKPTTASSISSTAGRGQACTWTPAKGRSTPTKSRFSKRSAAKPVSSSLGARLAIRSRKRTSIFACTISALGMNVIRLPATTASKRSWIVREFVHRPAQGSSVRAIWSH